MTDMEGIKSDRETCAGTGVWHIALPAGAHSQAPAQGVHREVGVKLKRQTVGKERNFNARQIGSYIQGFLTTTKSLII